MKNLKSESVFGFMALITAVAIIFGTSAHAGSLISGYSTIQAAIDAASDGDTVLVADGIYTGEGNKNLDFNGKAIIVKSENGPGNCIIDCENDGRGFHFHSGEGGDSVVSGFTIINGAMTTGGGIVCNASSPTITRCIFRGNRAENYGGGIYCNSAASPVISHCIFDDNESSFYGGGGISCNKIAPQPTYVLDEIASEQGHEVLRTPPYHPELQPIETCWGIVKNEIARNCDFTMDNLIHQLESAFDKVTGKTCAGLIKKVRNIEDTFWRDDALLDEQY